MPSIIIIKICFLINWYYISLALWCIHCIHHYIHGCICIQQTITPTLQSKLNRVSLLCLGSVCLSLLLYSELYLYSRGEERTGWTLISLKLTIHHEISYPAGSGVESRGTTWRTKLSSVEKLKPPPAGLVTGTMKVCHYSNLTWCLPAYHHHHHPNFS